MSSSDITKLDIVELILKGKQKQSPVMGSANAFAPTNIALCKYWGKRNQQINLPMTSSLSISLADKGATTELSVNSLGRDEIYLNGQLVDPSSFFATRLISYLNLFRMQQSFFLTIHIDSTIPIAAGLASSACGFAALVKALDQLFAWNLHSSALSILARLGSGSASRSILSGFVEWYRGERADGMDSYAEAMPLVWPELSLGLLLIDTTEKRISSREAMQNTVETSMLYSRWPDQVNHDLPLLKQAIECRDFSLLGQVAESNALAMHATMLSAWPPVSYTLPQTVLAMQKIWDLRKAGFPIYFTQDAGPNVKVLFLAEQTARIKNEFPDVDIVRPFVSATVE